MCNCQPLFTEEAPEWGSESGSDLPRATQLSGHRGQVGVQAGMCSSPSQLATVAHTKLLGGHWMLKDPNLEVRTQEGLA